MATGSEKFPESVKNVRRQLGISQVFCLRNDRPELVSIINKGLAQFTKQEKIAMRNKWFGSPVKKTAKASNTISLSAAEQDFLDIHPVIRVANEMDWPPFDYNEFGRPKGLSIDFIKLLANKAGFKIQFVNDYTWTQLLTLFQKKQIDVIPGLYKNKAREAYTLYSKPYYKGKLGIFTRHDDKEIHYVEDLSGKLVGIQASHGSIPAIRKLVPNIMKGITSLKMSGWAKEFDQGRNRKFHFMAQNNAPELISILNKALASLTPGDIEALEREWFGNRKDEKSGTDDRITLNSDEKKYLAEKGEVITSAKLFIDDIRNQLKNTFAVLSGASIIKKLQQRYPEIDLMNVGTVMEGLKKVRNGDVFGYIDSSSVIVYAIQDTMMIDIKIAGKLAFDIELAAVTRSNDPFLSNILQKAVDSLTDDEKQRIHNKWTPVNFEQGIDYALVWKTIIVTIIIISVMTLWNHKLHIARNATQHALDKLGETQKKLQIKNEELEHIAITDRLTGLYNRVKLDQALKNEVLRFKRYNNIVSLIILDIDYFKKVNDTFGHQAGDKVLQEVAATLLNNVRDVDIVGRWGGEEFLVICPETNLAMALSTAEKLRAEVEQQNKGKDLNITASFGVAELMNDEEVADIIRKADSALYMAKENGRNRVESI